MSKPITVWLVDDDASIRWVLERALRAAGLTTTAFPAAEPARQALASARPDVLITDVRMTGESGLALLALRLEPLLFLVGPLVGRGFPGPAAHSTYHACSDAMIQRMGGAEGKRDTLCRKRAGRLFF